MSGAAISPREFDTFKQANEKDHQNFNDRIAKHSDEIDDLKLNTGLLRQLHEQQLEIIKDIKKNNGNGHTKIWQTKWFERSITWGLIIIFVITLAAVGTNLYSQWHDVILEIVRRGGS